MGRKATVNLNLPPNLRKRVRRSRVYYYYDTGGKPRREIPLGSDYINAIREWSKLERERLPENAQVTFTTVAMRYEREVIPYKAIATQKGNIRQLRNLLTFFDNGNPAPLEEIVSDHIKQYYEWRKNAPIVANKEIALFSHIWTKAIEWGYTEKINPARAIPKNKETPREYYIEDHIFNILKSFADNELKDAMELSYLTGQRPADILKMHKNHIYDGILHITQNKTKVKLRFKITGNLKKLINKLVKNTNGFLIHKNNNPIPIKTLEAHFAKARKNAIMAYPELADEILMCQFRDIRAKSGTDKYLKYGREQAQEHLGHTTQAMTKRYIRKGKIIEPL